MHSSLKPRVVVSKCLGFEACRYNGEMIRDTFLHHLQPHVEFVFVCPEVEIGLGIPRDPVRLVSLSGGDDPDLVQPDTERVLTESMKRFNQEFLDTVGDVDGFVLKSGSPSCALRDAKYYRSPGKGAAYGRGPGLFGGAVLQKFPHAAIEDEGRLRNLILREHYLTRLFTRARFRKFRKSPSPHQLVHFHTTHKLLLMAYNQKEMRMLGRIVANPQRRPFEEIVDTYEEHLSRALARSPRHVSNINVLMHSLGYVSDQLMAREKAYFLDLLERYRNRQIPLSTPAGVLRSWLIRFDTRYLLDQVFFDPFPEGLVSMADSGRGRLRR